MKKLDILMINHFTTFPSEGGNSRFDYIARALCKYGKDVEMVTSSFAHIEKKHRDEGICCDLPYKLTLLNEPGYKKNISLKRLYSHWKFAENVSNYLRTRKTPDVIYCSVPSLDVGYVAAKYAKKNKIRFIIDVQDLWPEAFKMVFNVPVISKLLFYPMQKKANYVYSCADEIIAVSQTYVNRAALENKKIKYGHSVFLGSDLALFDQYTKISSYKKSDEEILLAYVGTLGHSYNIKCIIDALEILKNKGVKNIKFIVMGDGPLRKEFEQYAKYKKIKAQFTGFLEYRKMVGILSKCDIAVNPITKGAAASIINKVGDYALAGLPVINTQENWEYKELVDKYNIGFNCDGDNIQNIANRIILLTNDLKLRKILGNNNRKLGETKFDRNASYIEILNTIFGET